MVQNAYRNDDFFQQMKNRKIAAGKEKIV